MSYNGIGLCEVRGVAEHLGERSEPQTPCYMTCRPLSLLII